MDCARFVRREKKKKSNQRPTAGLAGRLFCFCFLLLMLSFVYSAHLIGQFRRAGCKPGLIDSSCQSVSSWADLQPR